MIFVGGTLNSGKQQFPRIRLSIVQLESGHLQLSTLKNTKFQVSNFLQYYTNYECLLNNW